MSRDALTEEQVYALAEYIQMGPSMLRTAGSEPLDYLVSSGFKIAQTTLAAGPLHQLVLYRPATDVGPAKALPVLREYVWQFAVDRFRRFNDEPIAWPALEVSYYQVTREELQALDESFRNLQRVGSALPLEIVGLNLPSWYEEQTRTDPATRLAGPPVRKQASFWSNVGVEVDFGASAVPALDAAWDATWALMTSICTPEHLLRGVEETYAFDPADYAYLISQELPNI